jgi:hypothetical protein
MHNTTVLGVAVVLASVGCSIPDRHLDPYSCLGQPLPTTSNSQITVTGTLEEPLSRGLISNENVQLFLVDPRNRAFYLFGSANSDSSGNFQVSAKHATPAEARLTVSPVDHLPTRYYPAVPIADDLQVAIYSTTPKQLTDVGVLLQASTAVLFVRVVGCDRKPLGGATVTTSPPGRVRYLVPGQGGIPTPSQSAVATDDTLGLALISDVPLSNTVASVTVNATVDGMVLRTHAIEVQASTLTQTEIQP